MERYVNDFIKYSIMNCDSAHNGDSRKANYANDKLRKIEKLLKESGEAEKFIDKIIFMTNDRRVLAWICSYAMEVDYDLPRIRKILLDVTRKSDDLTAFEAKTMLKIIANKKKKEKN